MSRSTKRDDADGRTLQFDLATVLVVVAIVILILFLTSELWIPHPFSE